MSKQIKKDGMKKQEKTYRIYSLAAMLFTVCCAGVGVVLFPKMTENESAVVACNLTALYVIFTLSCLVQAWLGYKYYAGTDKPSGVGHSAISVICFLASAVNARFFAVMTLSALGKEGAVDKLLGSQTMDTFIDSMGSSWIGLASSMVAIIFLGCLSAGRLISARH